MSIFLCLAGKKSTRSVMIVSIKELPTAEDSLEQGRKNLSVQSPTGGLMINIAEWEFKAFRLDGDAALMGKRLRKWMMQTLGMPLPMAIQTIRDVGKGVGEILGIPDKGPKYEDWTAKYVGGQERPHSENSDDQAHDGGEQRGPMGSPPSISGN